MRVIYSEIEGPLILEPTVFGDSRGFFMESFNARDFAEVTGTQVNFVQDNHSKSSRGVVRGLHYQIQQPQGKLVRVVRGSIFDVAVDLRRSSPTFGRWVGTEISEENRRQFWIPPGFAHGFFVRSMTAEVLYKATDYYAPQHERTLLWNDPDIGIAWPHWDDDPLLSDKDLRGLRLKDAQTYA